MVVESEVLLGASCTKATMKERLGAGIRGERCSGGDNGERDGVLLSFSEFE